MKMFVWIVTALFCGAGVGAVTVNIVWQQRVEAENQARIEIFEAEREAERERIEAGSFSDNEAEIFIRMLNKFNTIENVRLINGDEYVRQLRELLIAERKAWTVYTNTLVEYMVYTDRARRTAQRHIFSQELLNFSSLSSIIDEKYTIQASTSFGFQDGIQQGTRTQTTQTYSYQPQPSQGYVQQPTQPSQSRPPQLHSVQDSRGYWTVVDENGKFIRNGRAYKTSGNFYNVLDSRGYWTVIDSHGTFVRNGRME